MFSASPHLPELSFTQESLFNSHMQASASFNDQSSPSASGALSPTDTHGKQLPPPPINSENGSSTKLRGKQGKKPNPLVDLVQTEEAYVTMLAATIRKVAAAWTKTNLPPKELDAMFRGIEAVFKANRRLLSQLKEVDQNPNNPNSAKALGDIMMNWIVDLEKPYTKFANNYVTGFNPDTWAPIASNTALPQILQTLTGEFPPDSFSPSPIPSWSLDSLFALPPSRLTYYRKLYTRLLKSTEAGRSDHDLLVEAIHKLDALLDTLSRRAETNVGGQDISKQINLRSAGLNKTNNNANTQSEVVQDLKGGPQSPPVEKNPELHTPGQPLMSLANSNLTITELEQKLTTDCVLDLFTLKPRPIQPQLNPTSLPYTRTIRLTKDVEIYFTPKSLPESSQSHPQGCIFLLTDLLLLCEKTSSDLKLLYPPLAAKHLRVLEPPSDDAIFQIVILKKETITLRLKSITDRDHLLKHFNKCIEDASTLPTRRSQSPPPPVPPLKLSINQTSPSDKILSTENVLREPQSNPPQNVDDIPIGQLSMNHTVSHTQAFSEGNSNEMPSHGRPELASNSRRTSVLRPPQLSTLQTDFTPPQPSASHNLYIPPPRGASNAIHHNPSRPSAGQPYFEPISNHLHMNVTLQGRPLTPNLTHFPNEQSGQDRNSGFPSHDNPMLRKSVSTTHLNDAYHHPARISSVQQEHFPEAYAPVNRQNTLTIPQRQSRDSLHSYNSQSRANSISVNSWTSAHDMGGDSPTGSPVEDGRRFSGPVVSSITAQFKCKVFLKLQHGQWKSLGSAKLTLYLQQPTNVKQLVAESDSKDKAPLISTIVLTDGVERVGKTGVAIELSDKGARTGIVYLIQLRNDASANGLFDSLLAGSDRAASRTNS